MTSVDDNHPSAPGTAFHHFPDFANRKTAASNTSDVPENRFRPLFRDGSTSESLSAADDRRSADDVRLESIRQKGYAKGFEAGQQDACQAANHLLAPHAENFHQDLEHLKTYQRSIADHASTHIVALAIAISERIMGAQVQATDEDLEPLRGSLIEAICRHHQLQLCYHPDDLASVRHVMDCQEAAQWESTPGLDISADGSLAQGQLINRHCVKEGKTVSRQVQTSLAQILQHIESRRPPA